MTPAQLDDFRDFYEDTLGFGNVDFDFPDPLSSGDLEVKFRIGPPPKWRPGRGASVVVSLDLEIQP